MIQLIILIFIFLFFFSTLILKNSIIDTLSIIHINLLSIILYFTLLEYISNSLYKLILLFFIIIY